MYSFLILFSISLIQGIFNIIKKKTSEEKIGHKTSTKSSFKFYNINKQTPFTEKLIFPSGSEFSSSSVIGYTQSQCLW